MNTELDFQKLLEPFRTVHYYKVKNIKPDRNGILVYGDADQSLDFPLIQKAVAHGTQVIVIVKNINESELNLLSDPNITVICHKLRNFQQLLSYKTEKNLFISHSGLDIPKRIILLLRDPKRVEHYDKELKPNIKGLKIFRAIDVLTPNAIDNFVQENHIPILQPIRAGKIGCAFSHLSLWKELLQGLYPCMMILEDDVRPVDGHNELLAEVLNELPITFDIIFLYVSQKFFRDDSSVQIENKQFITKGYYTEDISAYIISRKGARKLVKKFKAIREPIEIMLTKEIQTGDLEAYSTKKMIFENIGQKTATQESILESNTYDSELYEPE